MKKKKIETDLKKECLKLRLNTMYYDNFWCPKLNDNYLKYRSNSCFSIKTYLNNKWHNETLPIDFNKETAKCFIPPKTNIKTLRVTLKPTNNQKDKILKMLDSCVILRNETIKTIKHLQFNNIKIPSFITLRNQYMKASRINLTNNYKTPSHILDCVIKDARNYFITNIKNIKKHNITKFRIRYTKISTPIKIMNIEPAYFSKKYNTFIQNILGNEIKSFYNEIPFSIKNMKKTCILQYNKNIHKFYLLIPVPVKSKHQLTNKTVGIDLGVRTFATCYNVNEVNCIGDNFIKRITKYDNKVNKVKKYLNREINKENIINNKIVNNMAKQHIINNLERCKIMTKEKVSKLERKYNYKITNLVNELQWKTINFILSKYDNIIVGKLSTHDIVQSNLPNIVKDSMHNLCFYKFIQRLLYKSQIENKKVIIAREHFTSQICSKCGNHKVKDKLKVHNCIKCHITYDRDINSAKNMLVKYLIGKC